MKAMLRLTENCVIKSATWNGALVLKVIVFLAIVLGATMVIPTINLQSESGKMLIQKKHLTMVVNEIFKVMNSTGVESLTLDQARRMSTGMNPVVDDAIWSFEEPETGLKTPWELKIDSGRLVGVSSQWFMYLGNRRRLYWDRERGQIVIQWPVAGDSVQKRNSD